MFKEFIEYAADQLDMIWRRKRGLEDEVTELTSKLEAAKAAQTDLPEQMKRAGAYASQQNRYLCPKCFIFSGENVDVKPLPSDDGNDRFRCRTCGFEETVHI